MDLFHDDCVAALTKDGWVVTHDPLVVSFGAREAFVDLGAERLFAAERDGDRIAVEIKSFISVSPLREFEAALGQFIVYENALSGSPSESDRTLYLAVRLETYTDLFKDDAWMKTIERLRVNLIVFKPESSEIAKWINWNDTGR